LLPPRGHHAAFRRRVPSPGGDGRDGNGLLPGEGLQARRLRESVSRLSPAPLSCTVAPLPRPPRGLSAMTSLPPSPPGETAVRTVELTRTYGRPTAPVHAVRGISLEIRRGERVGLLGKSGSGKSTLLNLLGGLDSPTSGSIEMGGKDLARLRSRDLAQH